MKKNLHLLILAFLAITFTSCIDIIEEITLKKDGTGQFIYTVDISSMVSGGFMDMIQGMASDSVKTDEIKLESEETILLSEYPDSIKKSFPYPEMLNRITHQEKMSKSEGVSYSKLIFDFKEFDEINTMMSELSAIQKIVGKKSTIGQMAGKAGSDFGKGPSQNAKPSSYSLKKNILKRMDNVVLADDDKSSDDLAKAQMFLGSAMYKTIYHFPKKIKKYSNKKSVLSNKKKTLTLETKLLDYLAGKSKLENTIKFKR